MKKMNIIFLAAIVVLSVPLIYLVAQRVAADTLAVETVEIMDPPERTAQELPEPEPEETPEPTPEPSPEPYSDKPDIDITSWEYLLVNADNNIGDYVPELSELEDGRYFDSRAVTYLQAFIDAARAEGLSTYLSSAYRSYNEQEYLYNRKVGQYGDEDYAATIVARPGTSEHQTGLCADITDIFYETKNSALAETELFKWMSEHCTQYGFVVRYEEDKQDITGIIYEPWHFRYVGVEAAVYMTRNELCLEEFLKLYK